MPDPLTYLKAMSAAAIVGVLGAIAVARLRGRIDEAYLNFLAVLGLGLSLTAGYAMMSLSIGWPPTNGLDRFLTIVLPAALVIEGFVGWSRVPRWLAWTLRIGLAAAIPRILLHGSVYLSGYGDEGNLWHVILMLLISIFLLTGVWSLLARLSDRHPSISIPIALSMTIQTAGLTIMMAGYIKGGAAAFPLVAALMATSIATWRFTARARRRRTDRAQAVAIAGIGVASLFGLLFVGRFFGRISTPCAIVLLTTPLLCWATELPWLKRRSPWLLASLRLTLVAIPLFVVLTLAKRDFDLRMAPLLGDGHTMRPARSPYAIDTHAT